MTDDILFKMGPGTKMPPIEDDPEQVSVNVADLRVSLGLAGGGDGSSLRQLRDARDRLRAALSGEPEWEPTDDMRDKARRAYPAGVEVLPNEVLDGYLREMHREGLL